MPRCRLIRGVSLLLVFSFFSSVSPLASFFLILRVSPRYSLLRLVLHMVSERGGLSAQLGWLFLSHAIH
jgi:NADH:ubiquinone oxidoreductase subunit 6 (subunit J)